MAGDIVLTICDLTKTEANAVVEAMRKIKGLRDINWWMIDGEELEIDSQWVRSKKREKWM